MAIAHIDRLHKRYGDTIAVDEVSLTVEQGEILGLVGPNGAGKTTTVECLAGLRRPDGGHVEVAGFDPSRDRDRARQLIGIQLQEARLPDALRVGEAIELYASFYPNPDDTDRLLQRLGLAERRDVPFGDLSGGQQQRLSIALALVGRPRLAVLDELTTGLDPHARRGTWDMIDAIRDAGVTVVLVSHVMEEVERLCDRVAVIDQGHVVALDTPQRLIAEHTGEERLRFRPGTDVDLARLRERSGLRHVAREGRWVVVSGSGDLHAAVARAGEGADWSIGEPRIERPSLDDVFLALTGRHADDDTAPAA